MARCPGCGCRFSVPEDERDMHDCPRCGLPPLDPFEGWDGSSPVNVQATTDLMADLMASLERETKR